MPQRQSIAYVRLAQDDFKLPRAFRSFYSRIDGLQRRLELRGRIFEEGCAGTDAGTRAAKGSGGNDGLAALALQCDNSQCDVQEAASVVLNFQCVFAPEIHSRRRRCFGDEQSWWRPCRGFNFTAV